LSALVWLAIRARALKTAAAQQRFLKQTTASASPIDQAASIWPFDKALIVLLCFDKEA
jgi:hypothetical protein